MYKAVHGRATPTLAGGRKLVCAFKVRWAGLVPVECAVHGSTCGMRCAWQYLWNKPQHSLEWACEQRAEQVLERFATASDKSSYNCCLPVLICLQEPRGSR